MCVPGPSSGAGWTQTLGGISAAGVPDVPGVTQWLTESQASVAVAYCRELLATHWSKVAHIGVSPKLRFFGGAGRCAAHRTHERFLVRFCAAIDRRAAA